MNRSSARRRPDALVVTRGLHRHPLHPSLRGATIGMLALASGFAVISYGRGIELAAARGIWLALIRGLIVFAPTAVSGLMDWPAISGEGTVPAEQRFPVPVPVLVGHGLVPTRTPVLVSLTAQKLGGS